jgi:uncharacterized protein (TIGR02145 family)
MKKNLLISVVLLFSGLLLKAQTVKDFDGNIYQTVVIGTQTWMKENLKTIHYSDGSAISEVYVYNNNESNAAIYGRLYSWPATMRNTTTEMTQGVCPTGWHVPSDGEYTTLTTFLGGESVAGGKMKEAGTAHWTSPNTGADNSSGFSALPAGVYGSNSLYMLMNNETVFWTSTNYPSADKWVRYILYDQSNITRAHMYSYGHSVRCIKNPTSITVQNSSHGIDQTFDIPVETSILQSGDGVISYQFDFEYDNSKLQYLDKSLTGTIAEGGTVVINSSTPGHLLISYMKSIPLSGAGTILKLQFKGIAYGNSPLTVSNFFYNSNSVTDITNGSASITDITPPTAAITLSDADGKVKVGDNITITATFNEAMADFPVPQIVLSGANTLASTNMSKVSNTVYTYHHTIVTGNGDVNISLATGTDVAGNPVVPTPTSGGTFTIDNIPPSGAITYSKTGSLRFGEELIITATFSEPMANNPVPQIELSGSNIVSSTAMTKVSGTVYTYNHTVAVGNGTTNVSFHNGTDEQGNIVVSTPTSGGSFDVIPLTYGDVDDNTFIRAYDAALVLQYSVGLDPLPIMDPLPWELWRLKTADVDGVTGITAMDASYILQYSAKIINTFPVEGKSSNAENASVTITNENGYLEFRSTGDLFGLNVFVNENKEYLGTPQILNSNMISAINISATSYAIGLATAYAPANGEVFMKIPFTSGQNIYVKFNMIVNNTNVDITVGLLTGIAEVNEDEILVYPNPANSTLFINGLTEDSKISIYDMNGKMIFNKKILNGQIDIGNFQSGVYTMKIETLKGKINKIFVKQ